MRVRFHVLFAFLFVCSRALYALVLFYTIFDFFFFLQLQACFFSGFWAVALPCFSLFSVVAVAARLNVFMARISANMQSDHNLLNVFFARRCGSLVGGAAGMKKSAL